MPYVYVFRNVFFEPRGITEGPCAGETVQRLSVPLQREPRQRESPPASARVHPGNASRTGHRGGVQSLAGGQINRHRDGLSQASRQGRLLLSQRVPADPDVLGAYQAVPGPPAVPLWKSKAPWAGAMPFGPRFPCRLLRGVPAQFVLSPGGCPSTSPQWTHH